MDIRFPFEPADVDRGAQENVNPAAVGRPAGPGRVSPEILVGIRHPRVVLVLEFVGRGSGRGIPLFPERFDEGGSFPIVIEPEKHLALFRSDDVSDVLFQPVPEKRREIFQPGREPFPSESPEGKGQQDQGEKRGNAFSCHDFKL